MDPEIVKTAVRLHLPSGWKVRWVRPRKYPDERFYYSSLGYVRGICDHDAKLISCIEPTNAFNLCVFLHECGHARMGHHVLDYADDLALCEYEAERYAIDAARALGVEPPKSYHASAVQYVRDCLEAQRDAGADDEILAFAGWLDDPP